MSSASGEAAPSKPGRQGLALVAIFLALIAATYTFYRGWTRNPIPQSNVTMTNEGTLCLGAATGGDGGTGSDLRAEQPLAIGVRSACLSESCVTHRSAKCAVKREGSKILVTSELSWRGPAELGERCSEKCAYVEAACATDPLPPGNYSVVLGSKTTELSVPSHRDERCPDLFALPAPRPIAAPAPVPAADAAPATGVATPVSSGDPDNVPAAPGTGVAPTPPPRDVVCIGPANTKDKSRALKVGQPLAITVVKKNPCVGASCALAPPKCVAKRKGKTITLDPHFPGPTTKPRQPCTEDCNAMVALCKTDALPAGTYTIDIDGQEEHITIPAAAPPPCGQ